MKKFLSLILIFTMVFFTYQVSYKVKKLEKDLRITNSKIKDEKDELQALKAEWMYLNSTDRLAELSKKYLNNKPIQPSQLVDLYDNNYILSNLENR